MDIFYENDEDEFIVDTYEQEPPRWKPQQPVRKKSTSEQLMKAISDLETKVTNMTTSCSTASDRIREEGNKLIQEFNKKYSDITLKEERSFSERAEQIEKQFYEKLRIDLYNLESIENDIKETEERLFKFNTFKRFMFWFGCFTNISAFSVLLALLILNYL